MIFPPTINTTGSPTPLATNETTLSLTLENNFIVHLDHELLTLIQEILVSYQFEWGYCDGMHFYSEVSDVLENDYKHMGLEEDYCELILSVINELTISIQSKLDSMGLRPLTLRLDYFSMIPILKVKWVYEYYPKIMLTLIY